MKTAVCEIGEFHQEATTGNIMLEAEDHVAIALFALHGAQTIKIEYACREKALEKACLHIHKAIALGAAKSIDSKLWEEILGLIEMNMRSFGFPHVQKDQAPKIFHNYAVLNFNIAKNENISPFAKANAFYNTVECVCKAARLEDARNISIKQWTDALEEVKIDPSEFRKLHDGLSLNLTYFHFKRAKNAWGVRKAFPSLALCMDTFSPEDVLAAQEYAQRSSGVESIPLSSQETINIVTRAGIRPKEWWQYIGNYLSDSEMVISGNTKIKQPNVRRLPHPARLIV